MSKHNATFPKSHRLLIREQFDLVFAQRTSVADDQIIVYGRANGLAHARIGLVVSRKVGNAVCRNRWKRLLREAFRLMQHDLPVGLDLVVLPRSRGTPELQPLQRSLPELSRRVARKQLRKGEGSP